MLEVKRKQGETTSAFLRRFTRRMQQSRILVRARKLRYRQPEKSKRETRLSAIHRATLQKEQERLEKLGKSK